MPAMSKLVFHRTRHNHRRCIADALRQADDICRRKGIRFTRIRRRVLELIWAEHRPLSAYALLQQLRREKQNAEPPTVYRALDFLVENCLVHKIESLNAFIGCSHPQHQSSGRNNGRNDGKNGGRHIGQFLICSDCRQVAEISDAKLQRVIDATASRAGLQAMHHTIEITGRCSQCR